MTCLDRISFKGKGIRCQRVSDGGVLFSMSVLISIPTVIPRPYVVEAWFEPKYYRQNPKKGSGGLRMLLCHTSLLSTLVSRAWWSEDLLTSLSAVR